MICNETTPRAPDIEVKYLIYRGHFGHFEVAISPLRVQEIKTLHKGKA